MKKSIATFCLFLIGILAAQAQTADEVIRKHIAAAGGMDSWKNIISMKRTGSINLGGKEVPVAFTVLKGKGCRMDMTIGGMANYMIITPTKGWTYFPIQGQQKAEALPDEQLKEQQDQLEVADDPLIDYEARGYKVAYLGKDDVEGTECFKLKATSREGKETTLYLDVTTCNLIRAVEKSKANGKEQESTTNYSNFQKLPEGIVVAMSQDGDDGAITFKSVDINKPVDEHIFSPDEVKK